MATQQPTPAQRRCAEQLVAALEQPGYAATLACCHQCSGLGVVRAAQCVSCLGSGFEPMSGP